MPINLQRRDLYAFLILALMALVLSVDVLGLIGVGDPKASNAGAETASLDAWRSLDGEGRQLLAKEHDVVVSEIQMRLGQEHLLFSLKFGLVGAILWAFLQTPVKSGAPLDTTPFAALAAWSAVVAAAIVDLRVMANQSFLVTLGGWNRQYEQLALGSNGVRLGWEAFLADNLLGQPYYPALRVSGGQFLTALLFCVTSSVFLMRPEGNSDLRTARISIAGAIVSIFIMTVVAMSLRRNPWTVLLYVTAGLVAIAVAIFLAHESRLRAEAPAADVISHRES
jgi:hypothetical protein